MHSCKYMLRLRHVQEASARDSLSPNTGPTARCCRPAQAGARWPKVLLGQGHGGKACC